MTDIWLRLTKAGDNYTGRVLARRHDLDGARRRRSTNAMADPDFGLFAFAPQAPGDGETVPFEYFTLDGQDPPSGASASAPGDEFDGAALDKTKWNAIVREDDTSYGRRGRRAEGHDGRRRHLHRRRLRGDAELLPAAAGPRRRDWVIETKVSGSTSAAATSTAA